MQRKHDNHGPIMSCMDGPPMQVEILSKRRGTCDLFCRDDWLTSLTPVVAGIIKEEQ